MQARETSADLSQRFSSRRAILAECRIRRERAAPRARGHAGRNTPECQTKLNSSNGPRGSQPARAAVGLVLQELGRRTVAPAKKLRTQESERRRLNLSNGCAQRRGGFLDTRKGGT